MKSNCSEFFNKHTLELVPKKLKQIQYEGTQTIDLKEIAAESNSPIQPVNYAWSTPNTVLAFVVASGYLLTFGLAFFYLECTRALQSKLNKCMNGLTKIARCGRPAQNYLCTVLELSDGVS